MKSGKILFDDDPIECDALALKRHLRNADALIAVVLSIDRSTGNSNMIRGLIKAVVIGWVMKKLFGHEERDGRDRRRGAR